LYCSWATNISYLLVPPRLSSPLNPTSLRERFISPATIKRYLGLRVKCPIFLPKFKQIRIFLDRFNKSLKYQKRHRCLGAAKLVKIFYKMTNKIQLCRIIYFSLTALHVSSNIFAYHQEHLNCNYSFWFYSRVSLSAADSSRRHTWIKPEAVITVKMLLMISENIARNMYSNQGTINYPTQLHLVGHFVKIVSWCTDPWMSSWMKISVSYYQLMTCTQNPEQYKMLTQKNASVASSGTRCFINTVWSVITTTFTREGAKKKKVFASLYNDIHIQWHVINLLAPEFYI
jgi:hypothetical protein